METLTSIRERLETHYEGVYRKIWIQGNSRHGQNDVLLTLFPCNGERYRIVSMRRLRNISFEEIFSTLQRELNIIDIIS